MKSYYDVIKKKTLPSHVASIVGLKGAKLASVSVGGAARRPNRFQEIHDLQFCETGFDTYGKIINKREVLSLL